MTFITAEADKVPQGFALNGVVDIGKTAYMTPLQAQMLWVYLKVQTQSLKTSTWFSLLTRSIGLLKRWKDNVNNGAMDNTSGTSVMETAPV